MPPSELPTNHGAKHRTRTSDDRRDRSRPQPNSALAIATSRGARIESGRSRCPQKCYPVGDCTHVLNMQRSYRTTAEESVSLNKALEAMGFIYATPSEDSEAKVRYDLGGFLRAVSNGEILISPTREFASIRINLPGSNPKSDCTLSGN